MTRLFAPSASRYAACARPLVGPLRSRRFPTVLLALFCTVIVPRAVHAAEQRFAFILTADQMTPPVDSPAGGRAVVTLNADATELMIAVEHDVADPLAIRMHTGDWGTNGPVVHTLAAKTSPAYEVWPLNPDDAADLLAGRLYMTVASAAHDTGEIRGQIDVNPAPQPGDVIITEIMYHPGVTGDSPPAAEWIELFNTTDTDIAIGGWSFHDEDVAVDAPCTLRPSGSIPDFVLGAHQVVVIIPDGAGDQRPSVEDFRTAWGLHPAHAVLQLTPDGETDGALTAGGLDNAPQDDGDDANDLPLLDGWQPCDLAGPQRADNEILVLSDGNQPIDVVNFGASASYVAPGEWPMNTPQGRSITLVPGDYPATPPADVSTYSATGNDNGYNWIAHQVGDVAGGVRQVQPVGVYGGGDVGSPAYLFGATSGNRAPVAFDQQIATAPGADVDLTLAGVDLTRPFFGVLLFAIKSLPEHGELFDATTGRRLTAADLAGEGYFIAKSPFNALRYENDGACVADGFEFTAHDGLLESPVARVDLLVQCGGVAITEIMYAPASDVDGAGLTEWVELFNYGDAPINLAGWRLADGAGRKGDFPPYILGAGASVTVAPRIVDAADFRNAWCTTEDEPPTRATGSCPIIQPTHVGETGVGGVVGGDLDDLGGVIRLHAPHALVDAVSYRNGVIDPAWPVLAPHGPSIYLDDLAAYNAFANDDPAAWAVSTAAVDGAYAVNPTMPFDGPDTGSPAYLPGVAQGGCDAAGPALDGNQDGVFDEADVAHLQLCLAGPGAEAPGNCGCFDADGDVDVDLLDFARVQLHP